MIDLILVRGLPGSGKSTLARKMVDRIHLETDAYFCKDGAYAFDGSKLRQAHQWCQDRTREALEAGKLVVVSNTFTQVWEMDAYIQMAQELGKTIEVITATGEFQNEHGVPEEAIKRMKARWEPYV